MVKFYYRKVFRQTNNKKRKTKMNQAENEFQIPKPEVATSSEQLSKKEVDFLGKIALERVGEKLND